MHRRVIALAAVAVLALTACDGDPGPAEDEQLVQQDGYGTLTQNQPAGTMSYSPTRETINFWIDTWDEPGKLSYVYLQAANGELLGYYVLEGLPVSYCASLTPTYAWVDRPNDGSNAKQQAPAPAMDGVYYSGGQCDTYYGKDASTGTYIEYTAGLGINVLLYEEPLARPDVEPLGQTSVEDVESP